MIEHLQLKKVKNLTKSATLMTDGNNHIFIKINHPNFSAAFALHGAHLLHFQVKQQPDLIYLSESAIYNGEKAIRGGVPICWPWFGAAAETLGQNLPAHGFARTSTWSLTNINENSTFMEVEFALKANETTKKLWNNDFNLTLKATLSNHIQLSLITENVSSQDFTYGGALHTYLNIGNAEQTYVDGLAVDYVDSLDNDTVKQSQQTLAINKPIDAIYRSNEGNINISDLMNKRDITINNEGNDSVVVWNPWITGAEAFIDLPDEGYKNMLCIESAITSNEGQLVKAGETHTLQTIIK